MYKNLMYNNSCKFASKYKILEILFIQLEDMSSASNWRAQV